MKYLKIIILFLVFCNLPSYFLIKANATVGQLLSYSTFLLVIAYYLFSKNKKPIIPFIVFGLLFFLISILVSTQNDEGYLVTLIKYFIIIVMGASVVTDTTKEDIYIVLLLGCLSIILEAIFIEGIGGRYRGFYINPNAAGYACILGYSLSFSIDNKKLKIIGQLLFSIAGLVTFSRTFLLIWILINLLALLINYKNVYKFLAGIVLFALLLSFGDKLDLSTKRMHAFSGILEGKVNDDLAEESRTETWSHYYNEILNNPVWGNGYHSFSGEIFGPEYNSFTIKNGVHNTFLMVIGEAGFFVLLYFLWIYGSFLINGVKIFNDNPVIFLISFSLVMYMLTNHNYFENNLVLFISMWLYIQIDVQKKIYETKHPNIHKINYQVKSLNINVF
ncbi:MULTISPECIES: O-antigen ligase family protein [Sphingobacterium]|uniref:O-antigen ligase family protein n=1 Tax=Sphingobacterium TaxID=28453 RepID=UPI0013DB96CF|nr:MULTISPECIES: O-antigen ligase family protein [unclassified Sphingobacterium]